MLQPFIHTHKKEDDFAVTNENKPQFNALSNRLVLGDGLRRNPPPDAPLGCSREGSLNANSGGNPASRCAPWLLPGRLAEHKQRWEPGLPVRPLAAPAEAG